MAKAADQNKEKEAPAHSELDTLRELVHKEVADPATHAALIRLIDIVAGIKGKA